MKDAILSGGVVTIYYLFYAGRPKYPVFFNSIAGPWVSHKSTEVTQLVLLEPKINKRDSRES